MQNCIGEHQRKVEEFQMNQQQGRKTTTEELENCGKLLEQMEIKAQS